MSPDLSLPYVDVKIKTIGCDFLFPYLEPHGCFTEEIEEADFVLALNNTAPGAGQMLRDARRFGKPLAFWTIEDPNSFETFLSQAGQADFIFTTDEACIPRYRERLGHNRCFYLPLACSPRFHRPLAMVDDPGDFVISANWYSNRARLWGVETVIDPLLSSGYTLALFCYRSFMWPSRYQSSWKGETSCRNVDDQYRHGRVVLGVNNQRSGMDGRGTTVMTSMRTFEALACGKPFLATQSDAYSRLGLVHGQHMAWVDNQTDTLAWAQRMLQPEGEQIALEGRRFVLTEHTYAHRLASVAETVLG